MCGIIGYASAEHPPKDMASILLEGLARLEYRGYDSAGMALVKEPGEVILARAQGRVANLKEKIAEERSRGPWTGEARVGIAHTRWATHGAPSERNAHPHGDCRGGIFVVHNGIIENYAELKRRLTEEGHRFASDTDTEVLAHLIEQGYDRDCTGAHALFHAVHEALGVVRGTYAIAVVAAREPRTIVCARNASPLLIGVGTDGGHLIASDASAIVGMANEVIYLDDGEIAEIRGGSIAMETMDGVARTWKAEPLALTLEDAGRNGHPHFMHKEIFEAPAVIANVLHEQKAVREAVRGSVPAGAGVQIVACGTAAHAGHLGKYLLEAYAGIPTAVDIGSEFRYRGTPLVPDTLAIAISQSGETADTLAALREAKRQGARTLGIVNVVGSTIAREADSVIYPHAGPEISVASTKAFISQVATLALMTGDPAVAESLTQVPSLIAKILSDQEPAIKAIAERHANAEHMFFLGRGANFPIALEGALKLKEIAYLHAEACPAGEFKHGPIAMIDARTPSFFVVPRDAWYEKTKSNLEEVKARGGPLIILTTRGAAEEELRAWTEDVIAIPGDCHEALLPILAAVPTYLFAYHLAVARGCDVDKPRNLAKSVTVE